MLILPAQNLAPMARCSEMHARRAIGVAPEPELVLTGTRCVKTGMPSVRGGDTAVPVGTAVKLVQQTPGAGYRARAMGRSPADAGFSKS